MSRQDVMREASLKPLQEPAGGLGGVRQGRMDISRYVNALQLQVNQNALCLPGYQLEGGEESVGLDTH
ncbi:unnamed protein product [Boreogadus saida]